MNTIQSNENPEVVENENEEEIIDGNDGVIYSEDEYQKINNDPTIENPEVVELSTHEVVEVIEEINDE